MVRRLNRKGYYFIIDALIGSTIIFLSLMIILGGNTKSSRIQYNYEMAEEYSSFLMNTPLENLSNPYVDYLVYNISMINNTRLTIMEQVDLFYYQNNTIYASRLIENLTEYLVPKKYGFSYTIINDTQNFLVYNRSDVDINQAKVIIVSRKITFLQINSSTMFGPALAEIKIWV